MKKRALISVYDKTELADFAQFLHKNGWELVSTGGTAQFIRDKGLPVTDVAEVTKFGECLGGRVKTLHPNIHAGILANKNNVEHIQTLKQLNIERFDLVCVNLYPFFEKLTKNLSQEEMIEFIDIGGPAMIRAAAKNVESVIVLCDPLDYMLCVQKLEANTLDGAFRLFLAAKAFSITSAYDAAIARYMQEQSFLENTNVEQENFLPFYTVPLKKAFNLRYGENPHQKAAFYTRLDGIGAFLGMEQLQGKELSYNNIRDIDIAWKAISTLLRENTVAGSKNSPVYVVALKHNTICGAAEGYSLFDAYKKAHACNPVSIFGGIVACSTAVDKETAICMNTTFLEVIIAPDFTDDACDVLKNKKNVRLLRANNEVSLLTDTISVDGGLLVQEQDRLLIHEWKTVTKTPFINSLKSDVIFGMIIVQFVKSNAIVIVCDKMAIGIGGGQTNRINAVNQALEQAIKNPGWNAERAILVSDAFFPFDDCVKKAHEYGIKTIIQPGGSIRDNESIKTADICNIAMVFTGYRHFKH